MTFRDRPGLTWRLPPTWLLLTAILIALTAGVTLSGCTTADMVADPQVSLDDTLHSITR